MIAMELGRVRAAKIWEAAARSKKFSSPLGKESMNKVKSSLDKGAFWRLLRFPLLLPFVYMNRPPADPYLGFI